MFNNHKKEIKELRDEIDKIGKEQMEFLIHASRIMNDVIDAGKKKFMYEIRNEDVELIEDGKKFRAIRKIID